MNSLKRRIGIAKASAEFGVVNTNAEGTKTLSITVPGHNAKFHTVLVKTRNETFTQFACMVGPNQCACKGKVVCYHVLAAVYALARKSKITVLGWALDENSLKRLQRIHKNSRIYEIRVKESKVYLLYVRQIPNKK